MKCPNCCGHGLFTRYKGERWYTTCWLCKGAGKVGVKKLFMRIVRYKLKKASVSHKPPNGWWVIDRRLRPVRSWPAIIVGLIYTWIFCEKTRDYRTS